LQKTYGTGWNACSPAGIFEDLSKKFGGKITDAEALEILDRSLSEVPQLKERIRQARLRLDSEEKGALRASATKMDRLLATEEEKEKAYSKSNINGESIVKWTGKYMPKKKLFNKVVLASKYQLKHINGLTFDFLFKIAKDLHEKDSFMMLGGGKGNEPIIINDGGKSYRAFLEGRIKDKSYILIMHLSNQEYKSLWI